FPTFGISISTLCASLSLILSPQGVRPGTTAPRWASVSSLLEEKRSASETDVSYVVVDVIHIKPQLEAFSNLIPMTLCHICHFKTLCILKSLCLFWTLCNFKIKILYHFMPHNKTSATLSFFYHFMTLKCLKPSLTSV